MSEQVTKALLTVLPTKRAHTSIQNKSEEGNKLTHCLIGKWWCYSIFLSLFLWNQFGGI